MWVTCALLVLLAGTTSALPAHGLDIVVRLAPEARQNATDVEAIPLASTATARRTGTPVMVPLGQVATICLSTAPNEIDRLNLERVATIEGNSQGPALTDVMRDEQTSSRL
jgi:hydrophobic/amphiphilic exporter-1 (mainly G- bacteria), HAE1 family